VSSDLPATGLPATKRPRVVVFDFGGVLLDWNPRYLYSKIFADPARMEWFLREVCSPAWNHAQDGGRPWSVAEAEAIARHPDLADEIRAFRARWQEMVPAPIAGSVAVLNRLAEHGVPLYAITNFASDTCRDTFARFAFFQAFKGIVISGDENILKPDPRIFHLLGERYGLDLAECVFIDDVAANCDGARACGMHAIEFVSPDHTHAALADLGVWLKNG
jgi:HAD superfamily hydrolase (TIGR01509 family)